MQKLSERQYQDLHDRSTRGEHLTQAEQNALNTWYIQQDEIESQMLTRASMRPSSEVLLEQLLQTINRGLLPEHKERFDELVERRQHEILTPEEHAELVALTDQVEHLDAERMNVLAQLATIRNTTVLDLMNMLSLQPPKSNQ